MNVVVLSARHPHDESYLYYCFYYIYIALLLLTLFLLTDMCGVTAIIAHYMHNLS